MARSMRIAAFRIQPFMLPRKRSCSLKRTLSGELTSRTIQINAISPDLVAMPFYGNFRLPEDRSKARCVIPKCTQTACVSPHLTQTKATRIFEVYLSRSARKVLWMSTCLRSIWQCWPCPQLHRYLWVSTASIRTADLISEALPQCIF